MLPASDTGDTDLPRLRSTVHRPGPDANARAQEAVGRLGLTELMPVVTRIVHN